MDLVLQLDWLQVYDNVLSEDYCNEIISKTTNNLSRQRLHPTGDYDMKAEGYRTSNQYFIPFNHDLDKKINECANKLTKINIDNFEQTSIIRYQKGQEYKPHYDHYDPKDEPTKQITKHWGNRIATALFFLNGDFEGGETVFPYLENMMIKPKTGRCIIWLNLLKSNCFGNEITNRNERSLHGGLPIINGEKFIATKWIRENKVK